jgi:hypothetical protein
MTAAPPPARVALEVGRTWTFAAALDWPGWCRRGRREEDALDALRDHAGRYRAAVGRAFRAPAELTVVGTVPGTATTDFGAPAVAGPWDDEPLPPAEAARMAALVAAAWQAFDAVVAGAPAELRKGPRGGGRDRDGIEDHVREAERSYGRKIGVRVPPRTPWPEQREALLAALRHGAPDGDWPVRYALRRIAWHVLDHAWEIEDKSD